MRLIRRLFGYACPLLLFLFGLFELACAIVARYGPLSWLARINNFLTYSIPWYSKWALWGLFVVLPLGVFILWLQSLFSKNMLILKGESGQSLKIREAAVNRYVHDYLETLPFVRNAKIRSRAAAGSLAMQIQVYITSAGPLDNLQRRIMEKVTAAAQNGLGINRVGDIDLCFESVHLSRGEAKKRAAENAGKPETEARPEKREDSSAEAPPVQERSQTESAAEGTDAFSTGRSAWGAGEPGDFGGGPASQADQEDAEK